MSEMLPRVPVLEEHLELPRLLVAPLLEVAARRELLHEGVELVGLIHSLVVEPLGHRLRARLNELEAELAGRTGREEQAKEKLQQILGQIDSLEAELARIGPSSHEA